MAKDPQLPFALRVSSDPVIAIAGVPLRAAPARDDNASDAAFYKAVISARCFFGNDATTSSYE